MIPVETHEIDKGKFTVHLKVYQDDTPIRGNAIASGDDDYDKKIEDELIQRLEHDVWAWALVQLYVSYPNGSRTESSYIGGCSYKSAKDFIENGYFDDMVEECHHRESWKTETIKFPPYYTSQRNNYDTVNNVC